jgi:hypothetical protein
MLPDGAHLRPEDWTVFYLGQTASSAVAPMLAHESMMGLSAAAERRASMMMADSKPKRGVAGGGLLYVLNCVRMKEDVKMRRGAMVKALAICSPHPFIGVYKVSAKPSKLIVSLCCCSLSKSTFGPRLRRS